MMKQGGGSAKMVFAVVMLGLLVLHDYCEVAEAANFTVGDSRGWTFNISRWPKKKCFHAGDILEFNYDPSHHNVVAVDKAGYKKCRPTEGAKVYNSGKDIITLKQGYNYFICGFPGHCKAGLKLNIRAKSNY